MAAFSASKALQCLKSKVPAMRVKLAPLRQWSVSGSGNGSGPLIWNSSAADGRDWG